MAQATGHGSVHHPIDRNHPLHPYTASAAVESRERRRRVPDQFCDYTSVSGFRFLHSRHPNWFRVVSAIVLFGSIGLFIRHAMIFVTRFTGRESHFVLSMNKEELLTAPSLIVCPVKQLSALRPHFGAPPDFAHAVSSWPLMLFRGRKRSQIEEALENAIARIAGMRVQHLSAKKFIAEAQRFAEDFSELLPRCTELLNVSLAMRLAKNRTLAYSSLAHMREWKTQNEGCLNSSPTAGTLKIAKCRMDKVAAQLEAFKSQLGKFPSRNSASPNRSRDEIPGTPIISCKWLDGGGCRYEVLPSDLGVDCYRVTGMRNVRVSYVTLKSDVRLTLDVSAFDNKVGGWKDRELRVIIDPGNSAEGVGTRSVCVSLDAFSVQAGKHVNLNIAYTRGRVVLEGSCGPSKQTELTGGEECERRKCLQNTSYQVDQSHSRFRASPGDAPPPEVASKRASAVAEEAERWGNGALLPELHAELELIVADFFDGHARLLPIFNRTMSAVYIDAWQQLIQHGNVSMRRDGPDSVHECPGVESTLGKALIDNFWKRAENNGTGQEFQSFSAGLPEVIQNNYSPLRLLRYYTSRQNGTDKLHELNEYINALLNSLGTLLQGRNSTETQSPDNGQCLHLPEAIKDYFWTRRLEPKAGSLRWRTPPLLRRSARHRKVAIIVKRLRFAVERRSAMSQYGDYAANNLVSIMLRFRSMTLVSFKEPYEYRLFNLIVDLGSTLGLYFGMSILTLFELVIFVFYRDASDPFTVKTVPPLSVIYNLPGKKSAANKSSKVADSSGDALRRRHGMHAHQVVPPIF